MHVLVFVINVQKKPHYFFRKNVLNKYTTECNEVIEIHSFM